MMMNDNVFNLEPGAWSLQQRSAAPGDTLSFRCAPVERSEDGGPLSLDEASRSVSVVAATENPVEIFDYERWEVITEVLLMSGCMLPPSRQIPLFDTHNRFEGTKSVLGSARDLEIQGDRLMSRAHFSTVPEAEGPYIKVKERHLTDFSIGYRVLRATWVPAGETASIEGRSFKGPMRVATKWKPRELSVCPIGADEMAKVRANADRTVKSFQGGSTMDPKLRSLLEQRGLAKDATDEEAWAFAATLEAPHERNTPPVQPANNDGISAAIAEERTRSAEIDAMGKRFNCVELATQLRTEGKSIDHARAAIMDHLAKNPPLDAPAISYRAPLEFIADGRDKFRAATVDALILRSGLEALRVSPGSRAIFEKPAVGAQDLMGYSLRELARECLRVCNQHSGGDPREMIGRALTTSDFPLILAAVANKSLEAGWETAEETWRAWCATGSVSDFKIHTAVRASEVSDLDEVPEDTEYKYGTRSEAQEQYSIATYGKLFSLSRQTIINDDLGALTDIPAAHGESAARKVADLPYAVLTANAAMGDGNALFIAAHDNLAAAPFNVPPTIAPIAEAIRAMGLQTDILGLRRLNIRPQYFLAPRTLEGSCEHFFKNGLWADEAVKGTPDEAYATTRVNPYAGTYFTRVYESRLDADSLTAYYFAAQKGKTVKIFFLNGIQTPYMETKQGWSVDGIEYKVRIDAGAKAVDWKGLYKNPGA